MEGLILGRWPKAEFSKTSNNLRKINVFGRFLEARSLQEACKVALWSSCCGLEGLKKATWMPSWLQTWLNKGRSCLRSPKHGSGSLHLGNNLISDGLGNWKIAKTITTQHSLLKARGGPRRAQEGLQNYLARFTRCVAALFGPILGYLVPSLALLGGSRRPS